MRVVWSPRALQHLTEIREFIAEDKPDAAIRVARTIMQATDRLESYPRIGRPGRIESTRELIVPGTPFIVAYIVEQDTVSILDVLHGARRWQLPNHPPNR